MASRIRISSLSRFLSGLVAVLLVLIALPVDQARAATCVADFSVLASRPWSSATTWTGCGGTVPQPGDNVVIPTSAFPLGTVVFDTTSITIASLTIQNGARLDLNNVGGQSRTLTVTGNVTIDAGGTFNLSNAAGTNIQTLYIGGDLVNNGTFAMVNGTDYINTFFNGATAQSISGANAPTFANITVDKSGGTLTLNRAVTVPNTRTLRISNGTLAAGTNLTMATTSAIARSGGSMTGTLQGAGTYDVTYTGNALTTSAELSGAGLRNVTVNLTAGQTLTLDQNRAPDGTLTVTSGILNLSTFTINRSAVGGTFSLAAGTSLLVGGAANFPANYNTVTLNATSTVNYNAAGNQTVSARA
jgi:hypothetical protein